MPFVEQSFLEYCESLAAELNQLAELSRYLHQA